MCNLSINLSHLEDLIYYLCIYSHEIDKCLAVLCFIMTSSLTYFVCPLIFSLNLVVIWSILHIFSMDRVGKIVWPCLCYLALLIFNLYRHEKIYVHK